MVPRYRGRRPASADHSSETCRGMLTSSLPTGIGWHVGSMLPVAQAGTPRQPVALPAAGRRSTASQS